MPIIFIFYFAVALAVLIMLRNIDRRFSIGLMLRALFWPLPFIALLGVTLWALLVPNNASSGD